MSGGATPRRIIVCADDFGLSDGVNRAILQLIEQRRINAASVMTVAPAFERRSAETLRDTAAANSCQIGLHVTLTAPFRPLTIHFRPTRGDAFLSLPQLLRASLLRRLDREFLRSEILAQLAAFKAAFGRLPDYVDGHQHVQAFPQVRDAFLEAVGSAAPQVWVRQCGRAQGAKHSTRDLKSLVLDMLSAGLRTRATKAGVAFNPAFAGAYDFVKEPDFGDLMRGFLDGLPDGGLVMCHPGFVDDTLIALDPLTTQREREHAFLASDQFSALLAEQNMALK
jgi:chitin disaccharide deacetylase